MLPGRDDPLALVLDALRLSGALYFRSDVGRAWGVALPRSSAAHFHLVESGRAVVVVRGALIELREGDLALLPRGVEHRLASSAGAPDVPLAHVLALAAERSWRLTVGPRPRARVLCGHIDVGAGARHPLIAALPPV